MAVEFTYIHELQVEKMELVLSLTDLNAQRILSDSRLAGIDIDTARCVEAIKRGDASEDFELELQLLGKEFKEIMHTRSVMDKARESFELKLNEIDMNIAQLIESKEPK